jgi:hypothetical protein
VKVYVAVPVVLVFIVAGLHVPAIPFDEFAGKDGGAEFWHNGPIAANAGVICEETVTSIVVAVAHCPAFGVNV